MLQVHKIRDNRAAYVKALAKRGLDAENSLGAILKTDEMRRRTQAELDDTLARSNTFSKEIGVLFKNGEAQKANLLKEKTTRLKETAKQLQQKLNTTVEDLQQQLYAVPNIPHPLVPAGSSEDDNEEIFRGGTPPQLHDGALPHWELAKKYDLIDFELGV
ncbi:MAG: serine--tRNA ligase, partial [Marinirhabdus sp.]